MRMMWLAAVLSIGAMPAAAENFDVKFTSSPGGLMLCSLGFDAQVPPRPVVDAMMQQALALCIARDPGRDILTMAFSNDNALQEPAETWHNLSYDHKTKRITRQTFAEFLGAVIRDRKR